MLYYKVCFFYHSQGKTNIHMLGCLKSSQNELKNDKSIWLHVAFWLWVYFVADRQSRGSIFRVFSFTSRKCLFFLLWVNPWGVTCYPEKKWILTKDDPIIIPGTLVGHSPGSPNIQKSLFSHVPNCDKKKCRHVAWKTVSTENDILSL